jgi:hypothetical protein
MPRESTQSTKEESGTSEPNFSIGVYPQLSFNNPTSSVQREVVLPGPQFLLPLVANPASDRCVLTVKLATGSPIIMFRNIGFAA